MPMTRRTFLAGAGAATATLGTLPDAANSADRKDNKNPICIFSKHLQWLDYRETAEIVAEIGFDGIDLTVRPKGHVLPERVQEDLPRALEAAQTAGLSIPMMTTAIQEPDDPLTERVLKTAQACGVKVYRMGYWSYDAGKTIPQSLAALKSKMQQLAALNETYRIHGAYQNHAGQRIGAPVWDLYHLLEGVNPNWAGCQYDVRHATLEGGTCWPLGLKLMAPFIRSTVIKDFQWEKQGNKWRGVSVPLGQGMVDFKAYFKLVKSHRIEGPISLHYEYPVYDKSDKNLSKGQRRKQTIANMRRDLLGLRKMLNEAELA